MPRHLEDVRFYNLPQPACVISAGSMAIVDWNARGDEIFGLSGTDPGTVKLSDRIQAWNVASFNDAFVQGRFDSPELCGVTGLAANGKQLQLDLLVSRTEWDGQPVFLVVFADAGPRVRVEEQLRQAQKMESIGMLAGGIAHDFNNLLTIIAGYSHMLVASLANDENNRSAAEQVIKASDRAAALTRQLLSFSRRQVAQNKVLNLNTVTQGMTPMLHRIIGEHIQLRIVQSPDLGTVRADSGQVEQVIMNLVVNARDAMPEGGKLTIEVHNAELNSEYIGRHLETRAGSYVMLAVSDSGIGMDAATREKLFDPFFTTKADGKGTGLGLSMVYGIVKRHGGTIDVYSEPRKGTVVKVYWPRTDHAETPAVSVPEQNPVSGSETVLLVEDDDAVRNIVRAALAAQGYQMLIAASGEEALEIAKGHSGSIDLLITDMVLPKMNGREVARRFHRRHPESVVLFTSGYTDIALHEPGEPDKHVHFIGKPFTPAALASRVRELLDTRRGPLKLGVPRYQARTDQGEK